MISMPAPMMARSDLRSSRSPTKSRVKIGATVEAVTSRPTWVADRCRSFCRYPASTAMPCVTNAAPAWSTVATARISQRYGEVRESWGRAGMNPEMLPIRSCRTLSKCHTLTMCNVSNAFHAPAFRRRATSIAK